MKNFKKAIAGIMALCMLTGFTACGSDGKKDSSSSSAAESTASEKLTLQEICDAMNKDGSAFDKAKKQYADSINNTDLSCSVKGDSLVITAKGDSMDTTVNYKLEGDYITYKNDTDDLIGLSFFSFITKAVAGCMGINETLMNGYINGLSQKDIKNDYFSYEKDESGNLSSLKLYIGGKYDMKELDDMVIDEKSMEVISQLSDSTSFSVMNGKLCAVGSGDVNDFKLIFAEYGEFDKLATESLKNIIEHLKPKGYEEFLKDLSEIKDVSNDSYQIKLIDEKNADLIRESIEDYDDEYSWALIHFGSPESDDE